MTTRDESPRPGAPEPDPPDGSRRSPDASGAFEAPPRGFVPGAPLRGTLRVPGSKSIAQRALIAASLARGTTRLRGLPAGEDVFHATAAVGVLGARASAEGGSSGRGSGAPGALTIEGRPPGPHGGWIAHGPVQVGESGTLARLVTAAAALCGTPGSTIEIEVARTLRSRRSPALFDCLRATGVRIESAVPGGWPLRLGPLGPPSTLTLRHPSSSQEVSALLLALAAYPDALRLEVVGEIPSRPYVELTRAVLAWFGARVEAFPSSDGTLFDVQGPLAAPLERLTIEPDASSAAVALCAGCLTDGDVRIAGLGTASVQGDVRILEHLRAFGCRASADGEGWRAGGLPVRGAVLDLADTPDLAPPLAVVAVAAAHRGSPSELRGLGTLRGKESDRLAGLADALGRAGVRTWIDGDALHLAPGGDTGESPEGAGLFDPRGDHRMAFAAGLLGLLVPNVRCSAPQVCAKSWPTFWDDLEALGAAPQRGSTS